MERTGIGDAELARRIPVSRPTLLRWKEGVTTRPRHRDDVLRCAELLRLTPEETNAFLLAAGFSAETAPPVAPPVAPTEKAPDALDVTPTPSGPADALVVGSQSPETSPPTRVPRFLRSNRRFLLVSVAIPLLVIATVIAVVAIKSGDSAVYPVAGDGESMILLAPFVNYTAGGQGFNVVGRLKSAVDSELQEAGLTTVRTVEWPKELEGEESALQAGQQTNAALVIWGEYDSGRVIARFTVPSDGSASQAQQVVDIASTPAELPATINLGLTDEVRHVALVTLGQLYLEQEEFDLAKTVLASAMHPPPSEDEALANLRFLLGRAYLDGKWADFDEAVWLFSQVLAVQPRSVEALNSRALAYLARARPGDAALGVDDLERALTIEPQRAATNLNLAVAYMERGAVGDVDRAIASLSEALEMQEDYASAYVNRAGAYVARGSATDLERAFNDLEKVLDMEPQLPSAYLVHGNAYLARGHNGDLQLAINEFSHAIDLSPDWPQPYFNRGLVHSQLDDWDQSLSDLQRAQELSPRDVTYNNTLCLQLAVTGQAGAALPYCDEAVAGDFTSLSRHSSGVANALVGRTSAAIADFEIFLSWVDASPKESCRAHYRRSRQAWLQTLKAGADPFDAATLVELRPTPAPPGGVPC